MLNLAEVKVGVGTGKRAQVRKGWVIGWEVVVYTHYPPRVEAW